jgi:hypothetical protein
MAGPWPGSEERARDAPRLVVAGAGEAALSSRQTMSEVLDDLLPDAPAERALLVAAAEATLAGQLRELLDQGMDASTAARLAAFSFASATTFRAQACAWSADAFADALGAGPGPSRRAASQDTPQHPLVHAPPRAAPTGQPAILRQSAELADMRAATHEAEHCSKPRRVGGLGEFARRTAWFSVTGCGLRVLGLAGRPVLRASRRR